MRINHNIQALNAYRNLSQNQFNTSKSLEKLSSGLRINRAADDAAGLAISEKMRSQIRGLEMSERNALDAISLIQTAEGALNETHSILQRMRELSVQAGNDTLESQDRDAIQAEVDQLTKELDRIAGTTQFNKKELLRGAEGGRAFASVSSTDVNYKGATTNTWEGIVTADPTDKASVELNFGYQVGDLTKANINGKTFTINGKVYEIDIKDDAALSGLNTNSNIAVNVSGWKETGADADGIANINAVLTSLKNAITTNDNTFSTASTIVNATNTDGSDNNSINNGKLTLITNSNMSAEEASKISVSSNVTGLNVYQPGTSTPTTKLYAEQSADLGKTSYVTFGQTPKDGDKLRIDNLEITFTDGTSGAATGFVWSPPKGTARIDITGKSVYDILTDIESVMKTAEANINKPIRDVSAYSIIGNSLQLTTMDTKNGSSFTNNVNSEGLEIQIIDNDFEATAGKDLTLGMQIGPNASERLDITIGVMDTAALGLAFNADGTPIKTPGVDAVKGIDVSSSAAAQVAISAIDNAITMVSAQRSKLGAFQNRLEHTINNLKATNENLTSSESRIRDVDMAMEMTNFTKNNILNQSAQAMLAQANQLPQGILQLLQ
ncbi:flagellin [Fictibacillus sp. b24]|uniref:flagellin N-terminal helical domain-containing protein n=1 Tax=Fictibacillus sp. b24 TaxID=3055863 RepID=UPI0025A21382|nr:flagellin [Fictibacillus sp. b24]MDM5315086.1 flagellin [Fictibacillus sp. b24]